MNRKRYQNIYFYNVVHKIYRSFSSLIDPFIFLFLLVALVENTV